MSDDDVASTKARDILIPVDTDKSNITCDDNDAHILGALYDVSRYYKHEKATHTRRRRRRRNARCTVVLDTKVLRT